MKCYCNDYPFLILEFSIINLKYEQFKWISVPSEGESSTGPNAQKLFAHIQTWKNFQQGRAFPMLWCIVLMRVPLRLKFAIEYAVGNPILAFITTWLSKWVVLRRKILSKVSSRKNHGIVVNFSTSYARELPCESLEVKPRPQVTKIMFPGLENLRSANSFSMKMLRTKPPVQHSQPKVSQWE